MFLVLLPVSVLFSPSMCLGDIKLGLVAAFWGKICSFG